MKRAFLVPLFLLLLSVGPRAADWGGTVKLLESSVLFVETEEGYCTAFVIDTTRKYVLTAAHCKGKEIWVDHVVGKLVFYDSKKDLMVLKVDELDPTRQALKLAAEDPKIGDEVMSMGYGMALDRPMFRKAMVSDTALTIPEGGVGGPFIATDATFVGGQSGGPVVDHAGNIVMIVQRGSSTTGIGVGASIIRERVGRFFAAK